MNDDREELECVCDDFHKAEITINSALILAKRHGLSGLHKSFIWCPYCCGAITKEEKSEVQDGE